MYGEYEWIDYAGTNYKFLCGRVNYVLPHLHREIELGLVLAGEMALTLSDREITIPTGGIWLTDPFQSHGTHTLHPGEPYLYVSFQVPRSFFQEYFPEVDQITFSRNDLTEEEIPEKEMQTLRRLFLTAALDYYKREEFYQLRCAGRINHLFAEIFRITSVRKMDKSQAESAAQRNSRMQEINDFIERNFDRKLLLSELAEAQGLSLHYLSHFFKENWGMSFQKYLLSFRCEKARKLVLSTQMRIADISFCCGFSDPKYLRRGFVECYGTDPMTMRRQQEVYEQAEPYLWNGFDARRLDPAEAVAVLSEELEKLS